MNSFANWLSAVGTLIISGFALWLSVRDRLINMQAELNTGLIPGTDPATLNQQVYILSFTNIGVRPVTVTNHCWSLPFAKGIIFLMPHMDPQLGRLCTKLPVEVTDGKEGYAFYANDFFWKLDKPEEFLFHRNRLIAWVRIHFFRVSITTTTGKRINVAVKPAVRKKLWRTYTPCVRIHVASSDLFQKSRGRSKAMQ